MFKIDHLDHVAIRVKDIHESAKWYEEVLGLQRVQPEEWGEYPIFMLAGNTGIALFPVNPEKQMIGDHFAFRVDSANYKKAKEHLDALGINYHRQDHIYYDSIYFYDPDGHQLELTVQVREL